MASKKHVASQTNKIRDVCAIGSSIMSGFYDGRGVVFTHNTNLFKKGPWTPEEDALLIKYVKSNGEKNWKNVENTGLMRCGKSCRLRWTNHLKPDLKKGAFSSEEERIVFQLHQKLGNRWSRIASKLPGRTDNEVKNFWNTKMKRRNLVIKSPESLKEKLSSIQQSEVCSQMNSNLNPIMNPQTTFSLTNPNHNPSLETKVSQLTNSTIHEESMISFTNTSTYKFNFLVEEGHPSLINNPNANPFLGSHFLESEMCSVFPCIETHTDFESSTMLPPILAKTSLMQTNVTSSINNQQNFHGYVLNDSLSFESEITLEVQEHGLNPKNEEVTSIWIGAGNGQGSFYGSNYYYSELSKIEATSKKKSIEDEMESMDDDLSSLLSTFSSHESPPELHLTTGGDNIVSNYHHFYLDQKVCFPSFSRVMTAIGSGSDNPSLVSPDLDDECIDGEDWINTPETS